MFARIITGRHRRQLAIEEWANGTNKNGSKYLKLYRPDAIDRTGPSISLDPEDFDWVYIVDDGQTVDSFRGIDSEDSERGIQTRRGYSGEDPGEERRADEEALGGR